MTRVVGGTAKGRRLAVPPRGTRPTSDRAREALFSSVHAMLDLDGAHVLDLFAGSGAVGLEALSRGAGQVLLVESDRRTCAVLRANVAAVGLDGAQVLCRPVAAALAEPHPIAPVDLAFADPPYALPGHRVTEVVSTLLTGWLAAGAIVVVERDAHDDRFAWPDGVAHVMNRRYGTGMLWYGRAPGPAL